MHIKPFDQVRNRLERQYENIEYSPESGLEHGEIVEIMNAHLQANPDEEAIRTRAWLFRLICENARIAPEPDDYFAGKVEHNTLMHQQRNQRLYPACDEMFRDDPGIVKGSHSSIMDTSHTCPNWSNLLKYGLTGLRDRALTHEGIFYKAVADVYDGAINLAERLGIASGNDALINLSKRPPETFREALQLAYFYHELQEMEGEEVRSMGRFDREFNSFYVKDLEAGIITRDQAKEMLKYFWIKFYAKWQGKRFGKPFLFGPEANELSYLAFEAYNEMKIVDPKFHVCLSENTDEKFVTTVIESILNGNTSIVLSNYPRVVKMLEANGRQPQDAKDYILIGCYEPAAMGEEMNCSGSTSLNLAKSIELTLEAGSFDSFEKFFSTYKNKLDSQISQAVKRTRMCEEIWPDINPSPLLSGTMDSCIESGKDVSQAGARYNMSGFICAGLANAVDSLEVIRTLVFENKTCTLEELNKALAANWEGFERLRLTAMNRVRKWGNNHDSVDDLAVKIAEFLAYRINNEPNARGGRFQAALYSIIVTSKMYGEHTGALPDGRKAGEPLALNTGASPGLDKNGVTSLINSVTKIRLDQFPSGTVLDIMLHPSAVSGPDRVNAIKGIVDTHFAKGGMAIQFNIFDSAILREAQKKPEEYANLQVRVCGWNVRFVDLAPDEQELFITKAEVA